MGHCKGVIFMKMKKNLKLWKMKNRNLVDEFEDFGRMCEGERQKKTEQKRKRNKNNNLHWWCVLQR